MQLVKRGINRDGSGFVILRPEEPEDMVCPRSTPTSCYASLDETVACIQLDPYSRSVDGRGD